MKPLMSDLGQPLTDLAIGRLHIQRQSGLGQRRRQRRNKTVFEIAVEALDFAFGLGSVRTAGTRLETLVPRQI